MPEEKQEKAEKKINLSKDIPEYIEKTVKKAKTKKELEAEQFKKASFKQKLNLILAALIILVFIIELLVLAFSRQIFGDDFADAFFGMDSDGLPYTNGFAWLWDAAGVRLISTLIIILIAFCIIFIAGAIIKIFSNKSRKAKTIGSILRSCVKYLVVLLSFAFILGVWGIDVTSIVAGLGVLTLIIGLGCQSLISDIISGLFIVFDDFFSVGDMVIIDGFRGTIEDIGLRAVKLNDGCGNLKSITNSSINTCVNLSRHPNLIIVSMDVSYNEDIERIEGIIAKDLPNIKKHIPQITEGPWYKGIDNFDDAGVSYCFMCTCNASDRFQVKRDFQRDVYQMMVKNNILVPYTQITVNPQDPTQRPKPTDEQK